MFSVSAAFLSRLVRRSHRLRRLLACAGAAATAGLIEMAMMGAVIAAVLIGTEVALMGSLLAMMTRAQRTARASAAVVLGCCWKLVEAALLVVVEMVARVVAVAMKPGA